MMHQNRRTRRARKLRTEVRGVEAEVDREEEVVVEVVVAEAEDAEEDFEQWNRHGACNEISC